MIFNIVKYENATIGIGYKWVITKGANSYIAFRTDKGLENWLNRINCRLIETKPRTEVLYPDTLEKIIKKEPVYATYYTLETPHTIIEKTFYRTNEIPDGYIPFIGLSSGSLVTCYYKTENNVTTEYRPNPNAKPDRIEGGAYIEAFNNWEDKKHYVLTEM